MRGAKTILRDLGPRARDLADDLDRARRASRRVGLPRRPDLARGDDSAIGPRVLAALERGDVFLRGGKEPLT